MSIRKSGFPVKRFAQRAMLILGVAVVFTAVLAMYGVLAVGIAIAFGVLDF
jgi:hypothetical protein